MKGLIISEFSANRIERFKRQYMDGLILETECYSKIIDCLVREFYMIKLPEITEITEIKEF